MKEALAVRDAVPAERIHFPKMRRQAWAPIMVVLDVIVTFSCMALLGYGLIAAVRGSMATRDTTARLDGCSYLHSIAPRRCRAPRTPA
jgi:hypothetical protein